MHCDMNRFSFNAYEPFYGMRIY